MAKKVLIIDSGVEQGMAHGTLNHHYAALAQETLTAMGCEVTITRVDADYDVNAEAQKIKDAAVIILQFPGFWMGVPWQLKKYMDCVFVCSGISNGDGRHRADPSSRYGSGGILTDKQYMMCSTWNAPAYAFDDADGFFGGKGIDGHMTQVHRTMAFLGMKPLPSFTAYDIYKNPTHEQDFARFKEHLQKYIQA